MPTREEIMCIVVVRCSRGDQTAGFALNAAEVRELCLRGLDAATELAEERAAIIEDARSHGPLDEMRAARLRYAVGLLTERAESAERERDARPAITREDARIWAAHPDDLDFSTDAPVEVALRINEALRAHAKGGSR